MDRACATCDYTDRRGHGAFRLGCAEIHFPPLGWAGANHPVHGNDWPCVLLRGRRRLDVEFGDQEAGRWFAAGHQRGD